MGAASPNTDTILDSAPTLKALCQRFPNGEPRHPAAGRFKILLFFFCFKLMCFILSNGYYVFREDRGSTVVKVLCYKSEGWWFDSS